MTARGIALAALIAAIGFVLGWLGGRRSARRQTPAAPDGESAVPPPSGFIPASHIGPPEPSGSVALRLAYQLERLLKSDVLIVVRELAGDRVAGISSHADRRLLDTLVAPTSAVSAAITSGQAAVVAGDALGAATSDRRQHSPHVWVVPIRDTATVGAAVITLTGETPPMAPLRAEVEEILRAAAHRLAVALQAEADGRAAVTDPLTGLPNRRGLEEVLARPGRREGTLIFVDLDRLSLLNRTLGQLAGDAALVHTAWLIHDQIRGGDTAARVGPEEFAVWLPEAALPVGVRIAERIRVKLGTTRWDWQGKEWPLSASFGVASVPETSRSRDLLLQQAEAAMMAAKKGGRNRVEVAGGK